MILGKGINDLKTRDKNCKQFKSYNVWRSMLNRCYNKKYLATRPTYIDCIVCDEWLLYSNFKNWFDLNYIEGYALDKDLLKPGNKIYSPTTCRFVPVAINSLIIDSKKSRGMYPIGVNFNKDCKKFMAMLSMNSKRTYLGLFDSAEEASKAYKIAKEKHVKLLAKEYFEKGLICADIYKALMKWQIGT